jgi:hypothetical protein
MRAVIHKQDAKPRLEPGREMNVAAGALESFQLHGLEIERQIASRPARLGTYCACHRSRSGRAACNLSNSYRQPR